MRIKRIILWSAGIVAGILALLVFLGFTAYALLLVPSVQKYALKTATPVLDSLLTGTVSIGRIQTNLVTQADLYDITVCDSLFPQDSVRIGHIKATFYLPGIITRKILIRRVVLDHVFASLSRQKDGRLTFPALPDTLKIKKKPAKKRRPSQWSVVLGKVTVRDINGSYTDHQLNMQARLSHAVVNARFYRLDSILVHLTTSNGSYTSPWWRGTVDSIGTNVLLSFKHLTILQAFINASGTRVKGEGTIPYSPKGIWNLRAHIETPVQPVVVLYTAAPGVRPQGNLSADLSWTGTMQNPSLHASIHSSKLAYNNIIADSINLRADYLSEGKINSLIQVFSSGGEAEVRGEIHLPDLMSRPVLKYYDLTATTDNIDLSSILSNPKVVLPSFLRYVTVNARITGNSPVQLPSTVLVKVDISPDRSTKTGEMKLSLNDSKWQIDAMVGEGNSLQGNGLADIKGAVKGTLSMAITQPSLLTGYFLKTGSSGSLKADVQLDGTFTKPLITCSFAGKELAWKGSYISTFDGNLSVNGKDVSFSDIHASGVASVDSLTDFLHVKDCCGTVQFDASVSGDISRPSVSCSIDGTGLRYQKYTADSLKGHITLNGFDTIGFEHLRVVKRGTALVADGAAGLKPLSIDANAAMYLLRCSNTTRKTASKSINITRIDSSKVKKTPPVYTLSGTAAISGSMMNDTVQARFSIRQFDLSSLTAWVPPETVSGSMNIEGNITGSIRNPKGDVAITFKDPSYRKFSVSSISSEIHLFDSLLSSQTAVVLNDSLSKLHINGQVTLSPGNGWKIADRGSGLDFLRIDGDSIYLEGITRLTGEPIVASGRVPIHILCENLNGKWSLNGSALISNGSITYNKKKLHISDVRLQSDLSGTIQEPYAIFTLSSGSVQVAGNAIINSIFKGKVSNDSLVIQTGHLALQQGGIADVSATIPLSHLDSLLLKPGLRVNYRFYQFPLALLSPLLPENLIQKGYFRGKGNIQIINNKPVMNGMAGIDGGVFSIDGFEPFIGPVAAEFALVGDSIVVRQVQGKWGEGTFGVTGAIVWDQTGLSAVNLNLRADRLSMQIPDLLKLRIHSADLHLTDFRDGFLLAGTVKTGTSRYTRDLGLTEIIKQIESSNELQREPDPNLQKIALRLKVACQDALTVDMNIGLFDLIGELSISGTAAKPGINGDIKIDQGYVLYLDRRFDIIEGEFNNPDPGVLNPTIHLKAQTTVFVTSGSGSSSTFDEYDIILSVGGELQHPEVHFSSSGGTRTLTEPDIISILTFGQPLGEIGSDLAARVSTFASERLTGFGARKLEQVLGIERIDVQGNIFNMQDKSRSPRVSVTKRVSSKLLLTYETVVGNLSQQRVKATYRLTPHFYLEGDRDSEGKSGVDLIFKYSK